MVRNEYPSVAGAYVEAMRTVRGVKNLFFGLLVVVLLFLVGAFCLVHYAGVFEGESRGFWEHWLGWAFAFSAFLGMVMGSLYALTLLIGLKISLAGRLEGVAGLTKGFFWSLLFLAVLLPWQNILVHKVAGGYVPLMQTVPGVLYGLEELKQQTAVKTEQEKDKAPESKKDKELMKADEDADAVEKDEGAKLNVVKEALLAVRFILYPLAALLLLVAGHSKYRPQRIEMPEPVSVSRLTEQSGETSQ